jgi:hypothetical protein
LFFILIPLKILLIFEEGVYSLPMPESRGLRHELPSPAETLGPWVRISLEAWMAVFVIFCLQVATL